MTSFLFQIFLLLPVVFPSIQKGTSDEIHIRVNQLGYLEKENKTAIVFSNKPVNGKFKVINSETEKVVFKRKT